MRLLKSKNRKLFLCILVMAAIVSAVLVSCGNPKQQKEEKIDSLDYTVCEESELPTNLVDIINDRKKSEFQLTYTQGEDMYLVKGYGQQSTGGYKITVDDVFYTDSTVCLDSTLVGPAENDLVLNAPTYPYVVVKIEYIDKEGAFY